ncbi:MAG: DNRLRE domain-containing protein [Planctomycetales bacterium]|nr:DNRLRE domain-containing protein [Planctomycetales bacterium]
MLVAVLILATVGTAILAGVGVVIRAGALQRTLSAVSVTDRNYTDALAAAPYAECGVLEDYSADSVALETETSTSVQVVSVMYWNGQPLPTSTDPTDAQWNAAFSSTCNSATPDKGLQRITYDISSTVGSQSHSRTASVLKRFNGAYAEPVPDPPPGGRSCVISDTSKVSSTWVNETAWQRDTNYSTSNEMNILYLAGTRRFSYLKFAVQPNITCDNGGTLPAGADIIAAEVRLYTFNIGGLPACGANSCWHVMERVRSAWSPATLTWNNQPCPTGYAVSCQLPGNTPSTILFEHGTGAFDWGARYQRIQSTQLLNDVKAFYANPSTNFGWVIKEACAQTYGKACGDIRPGFQMRSSRAADAAQRPTLTVYF